MAPATHLPKKKPSAASSSSKSQKPTSTAVTDLPKKVQSLESTLLTAKPFNPNPLLPLLALARNGQAEVVHKAIWALHRVFVRYIEEGRVSGLGTKADEDEKEVESGVRAWIGERLGEYVEVLGGLVRDSEEDLRKSSVPLLFSLLPPLSAAVVRPSLHIAYFRTLLRIFVVPQPSLRGATTSTSPASSSTSGKWKTFEANQVDLDEGVLPDDVSEAVTEMWAQNDDLRWGFFREASNMLRTSPEPLVAHPENLLQMLLPLTNLPRVPSDINTFFIPHLASSPSTSSAPPPKKKRSKAGTTTKKGKELDALPDWMAAYDSPSSDEDEDADATNGIGNKRSRPRTSALSIHKAIHSIPSHTSMYTSLWETVLAVLPLDAATTRRILMGLHGEQGILSHWRVERRVTLADWLGALVDRGGGEAVLAVNGIFVLMTQYNLEYPNFYEKLYSLLDGTILHAKYRARFFRLLDTFLTSSLLPAALVAGFIKRLARLSLTAPPAGIIMLIPFIYNLLKRHPGCMVMIQRYDDEGERDESGRYIDPYQAEEPSPSKSRAIDSSLWELAALQTHYLASISTLAKVFTEAFTKPEFQMEDFLDHGYNTLFENEMNRKIRSAPALSVEMETEAGVGELFPVWKEPGAGGEEEAAAGGEADLVNELWCWD